ncbi:aldo/keto reductase family oxidoreductase [Terriglobus aquaticus]|uniref:Aldo/keto reductase family oxidoreductase n=2 Tax=Terriglobus aquaticus TaxID=940139 RepID=A0ABW9KII9_9BACT
MATNNLGGTFTFPDTNLTVNRLGYGAMQLAGPGVYGPPKDHDTAIAVLQAAVEAGVNHIDTSDFYGPHVTNQLIQEALYPYPENLVIVTKLGARREADKSWKPAQSPSELRSGVEDNLRNLRLDSLQVVNMRIMGNGPHGPTEGSVREQIEALAQMQQEGKIQHIGVSNVTAAQVREARSIVPIVCVQNLYNLVQREDESLLDELAADHIPYVPFFPLGGFTPLQSSELETVARSLNATPMQVALAWLLQRSPNILLIPGTSSLKHLEENLAAASLKLGEEALASLNQIGR